MACRTFKRQETFSRPPIRETFADSEIFAFKCDVCTYYIDIKKKKKNNRSTEFTIRNRKIVMHDLRLGM